MTTKQPGKRRNTSKKPPLELQPIRRYWDIVVRHACAGNAGDTHTHLRLPVHVPARDEADQLPPYWPPGSAARREASDAGYPFHLFDRQGGWAITAAEVACLELSWAGEDEDYGQPDDDDEDDGNWARVYDGVELYEMGGGSEP